MMEKEESDDDRTSICDFIIISSDKGFQCPKSEFARVLLFQSFKQIK